MATATLNPAFTALHGRVGEIVFKTYRARGGNRIVLSRVPRFEGYVPSPAQAAQRARLREATAHAQRIHADPALKARYLATAQKLGRSPFRLAISDYLRGLHRAAPPLRPGDPAGADSPRDAAPPVLRPRVPPRNAKPETPASAPATPPLQPGTQNPRRGTPNPKPDTPPHRIRPMSVQRSTLKVQRCPARPSPRARPSAPRLSTLHSSAASRAHRLNPKLKPRDSLCSPLLPSAKPTTGRAIVGAGLSRDSPSGSSRLVRYGGECG